MAEDLEGGDEGGDGVGEFRGVGPIGLRFSRREREMDCVRVGVVGTPKRRDMLFASWGWRVVLVVLSLKAPYGASQQ